MLTPLIVDIETDGAAPQTGELLCIGWCLATDTHAAVWCPGDPAGDLGAMLADPERPVVSHTKYDARYLRLQGWDVTGPFYDTQVMAWVLNENQVLSLDKLAKRYVGVEMDKRIKRRDGLPWFQCDDGSLVPLGEAPFEQMSAYNIRDVEATTQLFNTLWARLEDSAWLDYFLEEEAPFTGVLLDMECSGLPVNLTDSELLRARLEVEASEARDRLLADASLPPGFNVNSGDQMAAFLYGKVFELTETLRMDPYEVECIASCLAGEHEDCDLETLPGPSPIGLDKPWHCVDLLPDRFVIERVGRTAVHGRYTLRGRGLHPTEMTPSGERWSTSSPVLKSNAEAMQDAWVVDLLAYRKVEKVLTTYLRKFPVLAQGGRLFGRFNQTGTKTGRLSSSEPNLQNIPAHGPLGEAVRGLFQGDLVVGDYSQLEPRLMAHFSGDPLLTDVYRSGRDVYQATAEGIFGGVVEKESTERGIAKTLVLAMGYGAGPGKVAQILTINGFPTDEPTAKGYLRELHALYATLFQWRESVIERVKQKGYVVTIGGRHRRLKSAFEDRRNFKNIGYGSRQAVNAVVQGSAGDIVRKVMVRDWGSLALLAQVHDELVWERTNADVVDLAYMAHIAETKHSFTLDVPLVFEPHLGASWFAAKEGIELPDDLNEETSGYDEEA